MKFWLGTHRPNWLAKVDVPLFVSRRTIGDMKTLPWARGEWALDSGGFTELSMHGKWTLNARQYIEIVRRLRDEVGGLAWAAPADWMCEPAILAKTGLTVEQHQARTIFNFLELRDRAPELPIIPVLQGWSLGDYWRAAEGYQKAGIDLVKEPLVGVGTVCRRQGTAVASCVLSTLAADGIRLHGFGFKTTGLRASAQDLASADSLAWSYNARRNPPPPGHTHMNCANCLEYALGWREELLESLASGDAQGRLPFTSRAA